MAIQDPFQKDMEKRLLVAMVLSMAVLWLLVPRLAPPQLPPPEDPAATRETIPADAALPAEIPLLGGLAQTEALPKTLVVENEHLILRLTNKGGVLESARLKVYDQDDGPLEVLPQNLLDGVGETWSIQVRDEAINRRLKQAVYEIEGIGTGRATAPVEFFLRYRDEVVQVDRRIRVPRAGYFIEMETNVRTAAGSIPFSVVLGPGIGTATGSTAEDFITPQITYFTGTDIDQLDAGGLAERPVPLPPGSRWVAIDSKFFAYLVLSPEGIQGGRMLQSIGSTDEVERGPLVKTEIELAPGAQYTAFVGPKDRDVLVAGDPTLVELIDYGWFKILVMPLLLTLKFVYAYVGNYGWAIIALTFIINLALFPVRYKQMASMKKMSAVQPEMRSIQDRYKRMKRDDPRRQKMNTEVMALYKRHGVNPLGGCLPLVIQMPFLFAFYTMLYTSIELRGAPFIGWIEDLARHDPYYVTPILMGATMVAQQKMTPAGGDPTQRKMMMLLPIVFTFFFLSFSSGLVLYFLFSNLFGMMFQALFQKYGPESATTQTGKKTSAKK